MGERLRRSAFRREFFTSLLFHAPRNPHTHDPPRDPGDTHFLPDVSRVARSELPLIKGKKRMERLTPTSTRAVPAAAAASLSPAANARPSGVTASAAVTSGGSAPPSGLRRILLIRHAECEMNLSLDK